MEYSCGQLAQPLTEEWKKYSGKDLVVQNGGHNLLGQSILAFPFVAYL
jgi:hypothetical protein